MKKITFVSGSTSYNRTSFIQQKGFSPFSYDSSFDETQTNLFLLSVESSLSKGSPVFIEFTSLSDDVLIPLSELIEKNRSHSSLLYLMDSFSSKDFSDSERDFSLFLQLPHNEIVFILPT